MGTELISAVSLYPAVVINLFPVVVINVSSAVVIDEVKGSSAEVHDVSLLTVLSDFTL